MEDLLKTILTSHEKLNEKLESIDKTMIKMEGNLEYHIKRTDLAEEKHDKLEERVEAFKVQIATDLQPLKDHLNFLQKLGSIIKWSGVTCGAILAIAGVIKLIISL